MYSDYLQIPLWGIQEFYILYFISYITHILSSKSDIISCGNFNIDYLKDTDRVGQVNALLKSYNLINTITFPTIITENSTTATYNIFLDISTQDNSKLQPLHRPNRYCIRSLKKTIKLSFNDK